MLRFEKRSLIIYSSTYSVEIIYCVYLYFKYGKYWKSSVCQFSLNNEHIVASLSLLHSFHASNTVSTWLCGT